MQGSLFSSYFLEEGIRETEDWKRLSFEEVQDLFSKISEVFQKMELISDRADEADTEDTAIRPILELLGFSYFRQKSISNRRGDVPDFVLFGEERDKEKFAKNKNWNRALAILEAKRWNRNVEKDVGQILRYLSAAEVESNGKIVWGILTNGRVWRLYYHKFPSRAEGYVEFDLAKAIKEKDINLIKLFYLLFRKEAFTPTEWRKKSFLEIALEEGKKWEERVSEN